MASLASESTPRVSVTGHSYTVFVSQTNIMFMSFTQPFPVIASTKRLQCMANARETTVDCRFQNNFVKKRKERKYLCFTQTMNRKNGGIRFCGLGIVTVLGIIVLLTLSAQIEKRAKKIIVTSIY